MTAPLRTSLSFVLGFSFTFLPAYGPFVGLFFFFATRFMPTRLDVLWWSAALLMALPLGIHHGAAGFGFGLAQVVAPWLVYRAFYYVPKDPSASISSRGVAAGLLSGLALVVGLGLLQIEQLNFATAKTIAQAIVWESNPALYGHTVLALGAVLAILLPGARLRLASLGLSALGVLVSGSREAAIAWLAVALAVTLIHQGASRRTRLVEVGLILIMALIASGFGPSLGWGRVGFLVELMPTSNEQRNLVQGSEIPYGDWWDRLGVSVSYESIVLAGTPLTTYTVTKTEPESWRRLQQTVPLRADEAYTLSLWLRESEADQRPGVQGWGPISDGVQPLIVSGTWFEGTWRASLSGPGDLLDYGVAAREGDWYRVYLSFVYRGDESPLYWWFGFTPDQRHRQGSRASFAALQLEPGTTPTPYSPGPATQGLGLGVARLPFWQAAWQGIVAKPLWGWGQDAFPAFYERARPADVRSFGTPTHAHSLLLHLWFERGLVGVLGLTALVFALSYRGIKARDLQFIVVLGAVLTVNVFDHTLFYGGVLYPLAAIAGWRAARYRVHLPREQTTSHQLGVSATLAAGDFLAVLGSLTLATLLFEGLDFAATSLASAPPTLFYVLLLWPAMAWREALYPGYGLSAPQELKKQVGAAAYAGLIMAAGTLLFYDHLQLPRTTLIATVMLSMLLTPIVRAGLKRSLLHLGFWGRPVVVLGAGKTGRRVIRSLRKRPLDGLYPVALFDDDPAKLGTQIEGVLVEGPLRHADDYAITHNVQHAIVAIPTASAEKLGELVNHRSPVFKRVQFIPDLVALPSQGVYANELDGMLALEVRRGLYSRGNQLAKRLIDVTLSTVGIVLLAPLLLALYIWVKVDSRGPALYRSERIGQRGQVFACLKYRSMHLDAEKRLEEVLRQDEILRREYERFHKLDDDPRLTRAGRIMRRFSLDELPQLYNVLKGEMSLVGPRPYLTRELEAMGTYREAILEAKPGITGHWQVSGRSNVTFQDRLEMEAHYVRNWSIWWDIVILVQTVAAVLRREGAR
jgi:Undecaprenyl-phosphate galactose phosphotransferase WbaP